MLLAVPAGSQGRCTHSAWAAPRVAQALATHHPSCLALWRHHRSGAVVCRIAPASARASCRVQAPSLPSFPPVEPAGRSPRGLCIGGIRWLLGSFRAVLSLWTNRAWLCCKPELVMLEGSEGDGQSPGTNGQYASREATWRSRDTRTWRH